MYEEYRRLYPKLRLSWSLYKLWVKKDWRAVWDYLIGAHQQGNDDQVEGSRIHKWIEDHGWQSVDGIAKYLPHKKYKQEKVIEIDKGDYIIVARPDLYNKYLVIDWKTGRSSGYEQQLQLYMWAIGEKCNTGMLAEIKTSYAKGEMGGKIVGVNLIRVKQYEKSKYASDWEYRFDEMYSDISNHLKYLNRYLKTL